MPEPLPGGNEIWLDGSSTLTLTHFWIGTLASSFAAGSESTVRGHVSPAASAVPSKIGTDQIRAKLRTLLFTCFTQIIKPASRTPPLARSPCSPHPSYSSAP